MTAHTLKPVVEVKDLNFTYRQVPILHRASFTVFENECVCIIGPNGGGKTTLLKLIAGLLTPDSGDIRLFGENPKYRRKDLAYVPQHLSFDRAFPITVLELVLQGRLSRSSLFGPYRREDKEAALDALDSLGLIHRAKEPISTLSGGQIQRALIARALASQPKLLLLDEPTSSVDPEMRGSIYEQIEALTAQMTVIMVTHDLQAVINNVRRVLCVQRELIPYSPEDICKHFAVGLYHTPLKETSPS